MTLLAEIIVYGSNEEEHRQRLEKVLSTLCHRNLTLNSKNCEFGMHKLVFTGHILRMALGQLILK